MLKTLVTISIIFCSIALFAQGALKYIDTTLDYKERFYTEGKLNTESQYSKLTSYKAGDTIIEKVKVGLWMEYFDRKLYESDETNYRFYRLVEYDRGEELGKIYYFKKNGKLSHTEVAYPKITEVIYDGTRIIYYRKKKIEMVVYNRFENDARKGEYVYSSMYYRDGQVKSHVLMDEANFIHYIWKFDNAGRSKFEAKIDRKELYIIKRKGRNARKEISKIRENGETFKIIKIDGIEIKRKKWNSKDFGIAFR